MLTIALALAAADAGLPHSWAEFGRAGALSHVSERVEIGTGERASMAQFPYRLRFVRTEADAMGRIRISSNVHTPLARWVDDAFARLAPCWRDKPL